MKTLSSTTNKYWQKFVCFPCLFDARMQVSVKYDDSQESTVPKAHHRTSACPQSFRFQQTRSHQRTFMCMAKFIFYRCNRRSILMCVHVRSFMKWLLFFRTVFHRGYVGVRFHENRIYCKKKFLLCKNFHVFLFPQVFNYFWGLLGP